VIGAGAVVTRDVPSFAIAAGNPARVQAQFDDLASLTAYMNSRQPLQDAG
jgi:acetyltransferase-like isoleucine patch superfamily enzyme